MKGSLVTTAIKYSWDHIHEYFNNWRASEANETLFSHVYGNLRYIYIYTVYVTGSAKRYTNAQAMIFLYKRCCSKTRNIFYALKKNFFGA